MSDLRHHVQDAPGWVVLAAGAVALVLAALLLKRLLFGTKDNRNGLLSFLNEMGPHGKLAMAGVAVALYGLWGFGEETAKLPFLIRICFVMMFDVIELSLFGSLYKRTTVDENGNRPEWTKGTRVVHYTAWAMVIASALANVTHAPNIYAAPFMALMPLGSAWVVELELRERMAGSGDAVESSTTGPFKLLMALWTRWWADQYAKRGIDPTGKASSDLVKVASARRAARQLFVLRELLTEVAKMPAEKAEQGRAQRKNALRLLEELQQQRDTTRESLERSGFSTDNHQALAVLRGLAGWTRQDEIALVDTANAPVVKELMESVAIMPTARKLEAAGYHAEAEAARQAAEDARQDAERARQEAKEALEKAKEATDAAEKAKAEAAAKDAELKDAAAETDRARREAEAARQEAEDARQVAKTEMGRLSEEETTLRNRVSEISEEAQKAEEKRRQLVAEGQGASERKAELDREIERRGEQLQALGEELAKINRQHGEAADRERVAREEADRLESQLSGLRGQLDDLNGQISARERVRQQAEDVAREAGARASVAQAKGERVELQVREAELALEDLRATLRAEIPAEELEAESLAEPAFPGSEAKQLAWETYLDAVTNFRATMDAKTMAETYGVTVGRAREWRVHFRARRTRLIAAEGLNGAPEGAERTADAAERTASGAERTPVEGSPANGGATAGALVGGQRGAY
ncbi:hypothetical protein [Streptomyces sp. XY431]|uniref:hypothetical protein n=1 Tax=Streptomyces sp. XY431 TaxID=1415562 RepID=UPI0013317819|nr:hypothetical protein [Streptomyces sp. XY431]